MRTLLRTLQDRDSGFLRAVTELWGFDVPSGSIRAISESLAASMTQPDQLEELIESLPDSARKLFDHLVAEGGAAPFAQIERTYGPIRDMGPGRRDREQPWRDPISPLEIIWYRGLLGRAFADTPVGPQEFVYVPSDLQAMLATGINSTEPQLGRSMDAPEYVEMADTSAVDDATTLLAAFRKQPPSRIPLPARRRQELGGFLYQPPAIDLIAQLLIELELIQVESFKPSPDRVGSFLESSRSHALQHLITAWQESAGWNDLAALPHLHFASGDWPNDGRLSRTAATRLMQSIPLGTWWDLNSFLRAVQQYHPAFQRPGGDFDSWYLQDGSGAFLNGIEHWDSVDGAYLRFLIEGPLHWLGMVDLGRPGESAPIQVFRLTSAWPVLSDKTVTLEVDEPLSKIIIQPSGAVIVPRSANRVTRYQIARISDWEKLDPSGHHFRLSPGSLKAAQDQGLSTSHILKLLEKAAESDLPPAFIRAVERWAQAGMEAQLRDAMLLRVQQPEILKTLSDHKQTARYLDEQLSPTTAVIKQQDWPALRDAAARLGLLLEPPRN